MKERNEKQEKEKIPKRGLEINREEKNKRGEDNSKPENKKKVREHYPNYFIICIDVTIESYANLEGLSFVFPIFR